MLGYESSCSICQYIFFFLRRVFAVCHARVGIQRTLSIASVKYFTGDFKDLRLLHLECVSGLILRRPRSTRNLVFMVQILRSDTKAKVVLPHPPTSFKTEKGFFVIINTRIIYISI